MNSEKLWRFRFQAYRPIVQNLESKSFSFQFFVAAAVAVSAQQGAVLFGCAHGGGYGGAPGPVLPPRGHGGGAGCAAARLVDIGLQLPGGGGRGPLLHPTP